ncbi:MAG: signal peptidase I [Oscillospiraceae bacterium]|nr:signal peptidase I [Oscillospiraceae bacterium]
MSENNIPKHMAEKQPWTLRRLWKEWGDVVVILAAVFVIFRFVIQLAWVPSGSMETTIPTKCALLGWRLPFVVSDVVPERGDIITFWSDELGKVLVKRAVGLPGEEVSFRDGYVYIDGEKLEESYLPAQGITECDRTFVVPEGSVFFLGDNRTGSLDARFWQEPYVEISQLQARPFLAISVGRDQSWTGVRFLPRGE